MEELKPCPFCGSKDVELECRMWCNGYGEYSHDNLHVMCHNCYAQGPNIHRETFSGRTKYGYKYLTRHPELRKKLDEQYEEYKEQKKQQAIDAWNKRS